MCIDIKNLSNDKEIFNRCERTLNEGFHGMRAASASMVLHCLKPMTFPIFNSNMGFDNIYVLNLVAASLRNGMQYLVITEIPYPMIGANIGKFLNDVAGLVESKKAPEIVDISNQSSKEGTRIVLELKKGADVERITNLLYKKTRLEDTFGVNMLAVANLSLIHI